MMRPPRALALFIAVFLLPGILPDLAGAQNSRKPGLIRDTGVAEGEEMAGEPEVPEPDPARAAKIIDIGNYYYKQKNYPAAIERYLEALQYQQESIPAYEALSRAYEKHGEKSKALAALETLLEKNPDAPRAGEYRRKMAQLEKK